MMDEQTIGHETMSNDERLASGERMRRRNLTLDWEGIDLERLRRMKQVRANVKHGLTNAIKKIGIKCFGRNLLVAYDRRSPKPHFYGPIKWRICGETK